jgi:hypothetical protein
MFSGNPEKKSAGNDSVSARLRHIELGRSLSRNMGTPSLFEYNTDVKIINIT